jgi:hypothetical protein
MRKKYTPFYVLRSRKKLLAYERRGPGVDCLFAELFLDAEQLVAFFHALPAVEKPLKWRIFMAIKAESGVFILPPLCSLNPAGLPSTATG